MNLNDQILSALAVYGLPVIFGAILISSIGAPLPARLLLLIAGSLVAQKELNLWAVLTSAASGAIIGDNIGYLLGRWGSHRVTSLLSRLIGGQERLDSVEDWLRRWEGAGIFFSRWLVTPFGSLVNITSGLIQYSWFHFIFYSVTGRVLWVVIAVTLGRLFSDHVLSASQFLSDFIWVLIGLFLMALLIWKLIK